jgi:hypothetical protein
VGAKGFFFLKTPTLPFPLGKGVSGAPEAAVCDWKGVSGAPEAAVCDWKGVSGAPRTTVCDWKVAIKATFAIGRGRLKARLRLEGQLRERSGLPFAIGKPKT